MLTGNAIGDKGAQRLCSILSKCPALSHLSLADAAMGVEGAGALAEGLTRYLRPHTLVA